LKLPFICDGSWIGPSIRGWGRWLLVGVAVVGLFVADPVLRFHHVAAVFVRAGARPGPGVAKLLVRLGFRWRLPPSQVLLLLVLVFNVASTFVFFSIDICVVPLLIPVLFMHFFLEYLDHVTPDLSTSSSARAPPSRNYNGKASSFIRWCVLCSLHLSFRFAKS
jgi:hypothetical protein